MAKRTRTRNLFLFGAVIAALIAFFPASGRANVAQATLLTPAAAATPAATPECAVQRNGSGTYGSPVHVVLAERENVSRFDLIFHPCGDDCSDSPLRESVRPDQNTGLAVFRVSRSYKSVKVYGVDGDGAVVCESKFSYTITRPAFRSAVRPAVAPKADVAARPANQEEANPGEATVKQGASEAYTNRLVGRTITYQSETMVINGQPQSVLVPHVTGYKCLDLDASVIADSPRLRCKNWARVAHPVDQSADVERVADSLDAHAQRRRHRGVVPALQTVGAWSGGGLALGALACGIASIATAGLAAGVCIPALAIGAGVGAAGGVVDAAIDE